MMIASVVVRNLCLRFPFSVPSAPPNNPVAAVYGAGSFAMLNQLTDAFLELARFTNLYGRVVRGYGSLLSWMS